MTLGTSLNRTLREQIRNKIDELDSVHKVYTYPKLPFEGDPTVLVLQGDMEGEFWSTAENRRIYGFRIITLFNVGQSLQNIDDDRMQYAHEAIGQVVEEIINALDSDYELGQFSSQVLYLDALDVVFSEVEYEGGYAHSAELTVRVHTDYSV